MLLSSQVCAALSLSRVRPHLRTFVEWGECRVAGIWEAEANHTFRSMAIVPGCTLCIPLLHLKYRPASVTTSMLLSLGVVSSCRARWPSCRPSH
eukprot:4822824-Pleurochrysis_carterae.AAC.1